MFNREFMPFFDLRFIILPTGLLLCFYRLLVLLNKGWLILPYGKKSLLIFCLFILFMTVGNVNWFFSDIKMNKEVFNNLVILYSYNFLICVSAVLWKHEIIGKKITIYVTISFAFLMASMLLVYMGVNIQSFWGNEARSASEYAFYLEYRYAGYAEDANYASLCSLIFLYTVCLFSRNDALKTFAVIFAVIGVGMSQSKTLVLGLILLYGYKVFRRVKLQYVYFVFIIFVLSVGFSMIMNTLYQLSTMATRFLLWSKALECFIDHPLFGGGASAVRSYLARDLWYVQPHNGYIVLLGDHGLFAGSALLAMYCHIEGGNISLIAEKSVETTIVFKHNASIIVEGRPSCSDDMTRSSALRIHG